MITQQTLIHPVNIQPSEENSWQGAETKEAIVVQGELVVTIDQGDNRLVVPIKDLQEAIGGNVPVGIPTKNQLEGFYKAICLRLEEKTAWGRNILLQMLEEEFMKGEE